MRTDIRETNTDPATTSATVLVVDDENNILVALRRVLNDEGYRVLTADNGERALEVLESEEVDLVISDMYMPGVNGVQLLSTITDKWPDVIRILLTGFSDMNMTIEAVNRGKIYQYVAKPWDNDELRILVRRALEFKKAEEQKRALVELTARQNEELAQLNATLEERIAHRTKELKRAVMLKDSANAALRSSYTEAIKVFSNILEARAGMMAGHSRRVAEHSIAIGRRMKMDDAAVRDVMYAALLHDIGKIGFSDELLNTPLSAMSPSMRKQVNSHPELGHGMLTVMGGLGKAAKLIRCHHELYDGTGYPAGLKGDDIPIGSRIIAVANEYDNLITGQYNGRKQSPASARAGLISGKGSRYDPIVVDVFLEVLDESEQDVAVGQMQTLHAGALRPGMVLLKDVITSTGLPIMPKGTVLDLKKIYRIQSLEEALNTRFDIHVKG